MRTCTIYSFRQFFSLLNVLLRCYCLSKCKFLTSGYIFTLRASRTGNSWLKSVDIKNISFVETWINVQPATFIFLWFILICKLETELIHRDWWNISKINDIQSIPSNMHSLSNASYGGHFKWENFTVRKYTTLQNSSFFRNFDMLC